MQLVIAEKAKMARALRDGLQQNFVSHVGDKGLTGYYESDSVIITFASGHLLRLYDIDDYVGEKLPWSMETLPFIPEKFKYKPTDAVAQAKQLKVIKSLIHRNDVTEIIHLGDPDREGELIVRLILAYNKNNKPVRRMWCKAILPETARDAYHHLQPIEETDSWFQEGLARQRIDWLWGINLSRFLTLKGGSLLPVGRVLIPIVKYIYDRDEKIKNFKSEFSWAVEGTLNKDGQSLVLRHADLVFESNEKSTAESLASKLSKTLGTVTSVSQKHISKRPNKMFSLLKLQSELNKKYGMSMESSMAIIQSLYLDGYLTYPRTPTEYISPKEQNNVEGILSLLKKEGFPVKFHTSKTVFDESKCAGHTAITVTQKLAKQADLSADAWKVYSTVLNRFVSNFYDTPPDVLETTVVVQVGDYEYKLVGEKVVSAGFLAVESRPLHKELPVFTQGEQVSAVFAAVEKESRPPAKVSVTELAEYLKNPYRDKIKNMDSDDELYELMAKGCTIGTEATVTKIIANAMKYGYISCSGKVYSIEKKGVYLIHMLDTMGINLYRDKNIEFNVELKDVYNLKKTVPDVIVYNSSQITQLINAGRGIRVDVFDDGHSTKDSLGVCPRCGGQILEGKKGYYCSNYKTKDCHFALWKANKLLKSANKTVTPAMVKKLLGGKEIVVYDLLSQKNTRYHAAFVLDDTGEYVNLKLDRFVKAKPTKKPKGK